MIGKRICFVLLAICFFSVFAKADIAPDPGYERVSIPLLIETPEDFSDYRFFFNARAFIQEVKIKKGEITEVKGGAGAGSSGELLAIPKKSLTAFADEMSRDDISELRRQIGDNKIAGTVEILSHSFVRVVKEGEADSYGAIKYLLKRSEAKGIEAIQVQGVGENSNRQDFVPESKTSFGSKLWMIAVGGLLSFAVVFFGVWLVRKKSQKPAL